MAGLKTLLGLYPNTIRYENQRKELEDEYRALLEYDSSEDLARFKELELFLESSEFNTQKNELLALRYANSEEYRKESEYLKLKKDAAISLYFKTVNSSGLKQYYEVQSSEKLSSYKELEKFASSSELEKVKQHFKLSGAKRFELTESGKKYISYLNEKKSPQFIAYQKFVNHKFYPVFSATQGSDRLFRFEELKKHINSPEFIQKQNSVKKAEFSQSDEGKLLQEFKTLSKANDIIKYFKQLRSPNYNAYNKLFESVELSSFLELERFVNTPEFKAEKASVEKQTFRNTSEYKDLQEFETLKKDSQIRHFLKYSKSKELANYNAVKDSEKLTTYQTLDEYAKSAVFIEKKKYLQMSPKLRWKQSEAFSRVTEFEKLKNSAKIKWYFKLRNHPKFEWLRTWQIAFEEDFNLGKIDTSKWLTRYYWGEELLNDSYSLYTEKHHISDGANLELHGSILKINTGKSYKQKYGWFEARIKMSRNPKVMNAFWMVGDQMIPHIDIVKAYNKCSFGIHYNENQEIKKSIGRGRFSSEFHVFSMEWTPNAITWRINGLEVKTITGNIPSDEMYLTLSAGLYTDVHEGLPDSMEIDWVRCYTKN